MYIRISLYVYYFIKSVLFFFIVKFYCAQTNWFQLGLEPAIITLVQVTVWSWMITNMNEEMRKVLKQAVTLEPFMMNIYVYH